MTSTKGEGECEEGKEGEGEEETEGNNGEGEGEVEEVGQPHLAVQEFYSRHQHCSPACTMAEMANRENKKQSSGH